MLPPLAHTPDPRFDLSFERLIDITPTQAWAAWTTPALITQWFTPSPWQTTQAEVDLRPGGRFFTMMRSPEGQEFPNEGCFLELVENQKLVWTNGLLPGYRPNAAAYTGQAGFAFTAILTFTPHGNGTKYSALVVHGDEKSREQHAAMHFEEGWGKALEQLVACMKRQA
ncbi:MAG: SRPBCC family protein [Burkholderiales bacterium]|nr:SRPBCC family protein [Burkholderiales bacterium]